MSDAQTRASSLAEVIRTGQPVTATVDLLIFRDIYHHLAGTRAGCWILVFLGDQVHAQLDGMPQTQITIQEENARFYSSADFSFVNPKVDRLFGSTDGPYRFTAFMKDVFRWKELRVGSLLFILFGLVLYALVPVSSQERLADSLLTSLSVFISIFTLFVLTIDPDKEAGYLLNGRFRRLATSDRYIALIGFFALAMSIVYSCFAARSASFLVGARLRGHAVER